MIDCNESREEVENPTETGTVRIGTFTVTNFFFIFRKKTPIQTKSDPRCNKLDP
jgi:hypothetical protein